MKVADHLLTILMLLMLVSQNGYAVTFSVMAPGSNEIRACSERLTSEIAVQLDPWGRESDAEPVEIVARRVTLRAARPSERGRLQQILADPDIRKLFFSKLPTEAGVRQNIELLVSGIVESAESGSDFREGFAFVIDNRVAHDLVGFGHISRHSDYWKIGYAIETAQRERGYARETVAALIAFARSRDAKARIVATVDESNFASRNILESFGFVKSPKPFGRKDGEDVLMYELSSESLTGDAWGRARRDEPVEIRSARLTFRAADRAELSQVRQILSHADIAHSYLMLDEVPYGVELDAWVSRYTKGISSGPTSSDGYAERFAFAIEDRASGNLNGVGMLMKFARNWEIGYAVLPGQRRQGFGRETVQALITFVRKRSALPIHAKVLKNNVQSQNLLRSFGFKYSAFAGYAGHEQILLFELK